MPQLSRWFIRSSLFNFVAALLMAVLLALRPLLDLPTLVVGLSPVYIHLFVFGWLTQLIFGVMHWMFPKGSNERPRGNLTLAWGVFGLLNVGLILRTIAEPAAAVSAARGWRWLLLVSAVLQSLAGLGFVANSWSRVRGR